MEFDLQRFRNAQKEGNACKNALRGISTAVSFARMTTDAEAGLTIAYNVLDLPERISQGTTLKVKYTYLADGTKVSALDASGAGLVYRGPFTYRRSSGGTLTFESAPFDSGRLTEAGTRYHVTDHLGSVRAVINGNASTTTYPLTGFYSVDDFAPFGTKSTSSASSYLSLASTGSTVSLRDGFTGQEDQLPDFSICYSDFGARQYSPSLSRWLVPDPMGEKYYDVSPYVYCAGNPVIHVDPNGQVIKGVRKQDIENFRDDIFEILADDKFAGVRDLINIKGKAFTKIDDGALSSAIDGKTLKKDEKAYIDMVVGAINSKKNVYIVEYVYGEYTSSKGARAFIDYMNREFGEGIGDLATDNGKLSNSWIRGEGNGLNIPIRRGSHSFIEGSLHGSERAVTSGHEVFGHGIPAARKLTTAENNANAIRTDNLIRRILGLPERDGSDHGGYKEGQIINPYDLPIIE